jgi:hypothetical protein
MLGNTLPEVAHHEAGHIVVAYYYHHPPRLVTVEGADDGPFIGQAYYENIRDQQGNPTSGTCEMQACYAGFLAQAKWAAQDHLKCPVRFSGQQDWKPLASFLCTRATDTSPLCFQSVSSSNTCEINTTNLQSNALESDLLKANSCLIQILKSNSSLSARIPHCEAALKACADILDRDDVWTTVNCIAKALQNASPVLTRMVEGMELLNLLMMRIERPARPTERSESDHPL